MTFWHRAIAIFLLMVFTPAAVLAGTPLRYCMGDDGHRALEFVLAEDHHSEAGTVVSAGETVWMADGTQCSDRQLLGGYQSARVEHKDLRPSLSDIPPFLTPTSSTIEKPCAAYQQTAGPVALPLSTDPRILARKTTVLLV